MSIAETNLKLASVISILGFLIIATLITLIFWNSLIWVIAGLVIYLMVGILYIYNSQKSIDNGTYDGRIAYETKSDLWYINVACAVSWPGAWITTTIVDRKYRRDRENGIVGDDERHLYS